MEKIEDLIKTLADFLWGDWLLAVLLGLGIFYTFMTGFVQIKCVKLLRKGFFQLSNGRNETNRRRFWPEGRAHYSGCGQRHFSGWPQNSVRLSWA